MMWVNDRDEGFLLTVGDALLHLKPVYVPKKGISYYVLDCTVRVVSSPITIYKDWPISEPNLDNAKAEALRMVSGKMDKIVRDLSTTDARLRDSFRRE